MDQRPLKTACMLPLASLESSNLNPRGAVDLGSFEELADSVRAHGILQPLIVRPSLNDGRFEVLAGGRRRAAAELLGLTEVPAVILNLHDDQDAAAVALVENIQRTDLPPLDEAAAYEVMRERLFLSMPDIARRVNKPASHVYRRLQLLGLVPEVLEALATGAITIKHADRLTRVPAAKQVKALEYCYSRMFGDDERHEPGPLRDLDEWIAHHVKMDLEPEATQHYFPAVLDDRSPEALPTLLKLSRSKHARDELGEKKHGLIQATRWVEIGARADQWSGGTKVKDCEHSVEGVVVHGGPVEVIRVCAKTRCPVHRPPKEKPEEGAAAAGGPRPVSAWEIEDEKRRAEHARWEAEVPDVVTALRKHITGMTLTAAVVLWLTSDYSMRQLREHFGADHQVTDENAVEVLIFGRLVDRLGWGRSDFAQSAKGIGFKLPRRKPVPKVKADPPETPEAAEDADTGADDANPDES